MKEKEILAYKKQPFGGYQEIGKALINAEGERLPLFKLHRLDLIAFPEPRTTNGNGRKFSSRTKRREMKKKITGPLQSLRPLELKQVASKKDSLKCRR